MKNPAPYIRQQLYSLLTGIEHNGAAVPVYEDEDGEIVDYKIVLAEQILSERDDKNSFTTSLEQLIEVVTIGKAKAEGDAIATEILDRIKPTVTGTGLANTADWQVINAKRISQNYRSEQAPDNRLIRIVMLRINFLILQKQ